MGLRSDHPHLFRIVCVVCGTLILLAAIVGFFSMRTSEINADRALREKELEAKEMEVAEKQATERTEERWQWVQKFIPWGEDEAEEGK